MGRAPRLSVKERAKLDVMKGLGVTPAEMASRIGRSRQAVNNYLENPQSYGSKKSPGRPPSLTNREKREIVKLASNSVKSAKDVKKELNLSASAETGHQFIPPHHTATDEVCALSDTQPQDCSPRVRP